MKKNQITVGESYIAKVSNKLVEVRIDAENSHGGWDATNLATRKQVRIKSAQRLRRPAKGTEKKASAQSKSDPDLVPLTKAMKKDKAKGKTRGPSGLDAAASVLKSAKQPMRCKDIVEKMLADGLWKTNGKTPAATLYSAILREMQAKGKAARFRKTDRGLFALNNA